MDFTEETATEAVLASLAGTTDPRTKQVAEAMVRHLHAFVREIEPTTTEWAGAIAFLTAIGHTSTATRQEFVLLSDVLGVSMLVEAINARLAGGQDESDRAVTASTVLGPFHVTASPPRAEGERIDLVGGGQPCVITGRVIDPAGTAVPGASIDVWQCNERGFYDVQQPGVQPPGNGRGLFTADEDGRFWFRTVVPSYYPIPTDGPVGDLLRATGRQPYRPAHVHFIVTAPDVVPLTTHLFVADSPYIDSDVVFAVNQSLVKTFAEVHDPELAARYDVTAPYRAVHADLVVRRRPVPSTSLADGDATPLA